MRKTLVIVAALLAIWAVAPEAVNAVDDDRPLVFSNTNGGFYGFGNNGVHLLLGRLLTSAGYRIDDGWIRSGGYTDEFLADIDVLILVSSWMHLYDEDKKALRRWLRNGGGLFLLPDIYTPGFGDGSNLDGFLKDYGITFGKELRGAAMEAVVPPTSLLSRPNPCSLIYCPVTYWAALEIDPENAVAAAYSKNTDYVFVAVSTSKNLGKGQLIVTGYDWLFYGAIITFADNAAFGLNAIHFLANGGYDLRAAGSKFLTKTIFAGDQVKVFGKIVNDGTAASEKTKVKFVLSPAVGAEVSPTAGDIELATMDITPIGPGGTRKIKKKVKIPADISPGDYNLVFVVDPDGTSFDLRPGNNSKSSKKKHTIE